MKSKIVYISLVVVSVILTLLFSACKKYPEDDLVSLRTIRQRMEAEWQIKKIEINGSDVTYMYNDSLSQSIDSYRLWFDFNSATDDNPDHNKDFMYINKSSKSKKDAKDADICVLDLGGDQRRFKMLLISSVSRTIFPVKDSSEFKVFTRLLSQFQKGQLWEIRKLYKTEMIWSINNGTLSKKIVFKKTRKK